MATKTLALRSSCAGSRKQVDKFSIAAELTAATGFQIEVRFEPDEFLSSGARIPQGFSHPSLGHLFSARYGDLYGSDRLFFDLTLDDREGDLLRQLIRAIREFSRELATLADSIKLPRRKGGAQ